jgi:hypothetical protein
MAGYNLNSRDSIWLLVRSTFTGTTEAQPVHHLAVRLDFAVAY